MVLEIPEVNHRPTIVNGKNKDSCCHVCLGNIVCKPNCKKLQGDLNHRLCAHCTKCKELVCKKHAEVLCFLCKFENYETLTNNGVRHWILFLPRIFNKNVLDC